MLTSHNDSSIDLLIPQDTVASEKLLSFRLRARFSQDSFVDTFSAPININLKNCEYAIPVQNGTIAFLFDINMVGKYQEELSKHFVVAGGEACAIKKYRITRVMKAAKDGLINDYS